MQALDQAFGAFLLEAGMISREDLSSAETEALKTGRKLGDVLVAQGNLSEEDLGRSRAYVLGFPYEDISTPRLSLDVLSLIPEPVARRVSAVAFQREGRAMRVAALDPMVKDELGFLEDAGYKVSIVLTSPKALKRALGEYQRLLSVRYGGNMLKSRQEALLEHARLAGATTIHLDLAEGGVRARYRIGGRLHEAMMMPAAAAEELLENGAPTVLYVGPAVTAGREGFSLEALGMRGVSMEHLYEAARKGSGLIIAAGPGQSGKTTMLETLLDLVKHPSKSTVSVGERLGLRRALALDPDIIVVPDIGDPETAALALSAAVRGKLVLAGMETPNALSSISKLRTFGTDPHLLSSGLAASVGVRVVPKVSAGQQYFLTEKDIEALSKFIRPEHLQGIKDAPFTRHLRGRPSAQSVGLQEVLSMTPRMRELVRDGAREASLSREAELAGMIRLVEDGLLKAMSGLVSLEDALRISPLHV